MGKKQPAGGATSSTRSAPTKHAGMPSQPKEAPAPFRLWYMFGPVALAALVYVLYTPSLDGPFVFDDPNSVTQSELVRSLTPLVRFIKLSTRPLTDYSYALNYAVGAYEPRAYHATNIALHALNVILAYVLVWLTCGLPSLASRYGRGRAWIALAAAAAFAVHPLATETVAYVSSRSEILVATFFLASLPLYVLATTPRTLRWRRLGLILLPMCAAGGLGSKELAIMIPPALALYDWCFLAGGRRGAVRSRWLALGLSVVPLFAGGLFFLYRAYTSPTGLGAYGASAGIGFERFTRWEYLMTQFGVITHYLRLVVAPVGLSFDYDWPLARSFWSAEVLLPLILLVTLIGLTVRSFRTQPVLGFTVLWTLLILAPTSSLIPIADLAVERRMYLPLFALLFLAAASLADVSAWLERRFSSVPSNVAFVSLAILAFVPFSYLTYARATLWGDAVALHEDGAAKEPGNPRIQLNLGVTYLNLGNLDKAEAHLAEAKRLYDKGESIHAFRRIGAFIHYNLGAVQFLRKQFAEAEPPLQRALELGGEYLALRPMAYYLLGRIAVQEGDFRTAIPRYEEAIRHNGNVTGWYVDLALAQVNVGQPNVARKTLRRAISRNGPNQQATDLLNKINALQRQAARGKTNG